MARLSSRNLRRRVIPGFAVVAVMLVLLVSVEATLHGPNQSFALGIYWPAPTSYASSYPQPNVYLAINYTGPGLRNYTYTIIDGATVLTSGEVPINHISPFKVTVLAPVPSDLQAQVFVLGSLVYKQNLTLA